MAEPLLSVVIPTRNRLGFLREAVESVRRQTYANWELIVVDDASEEKTWDWLCSLEDSRIRTLRVKRRSERTSARNRGLAEARGDFVLFLDDDDRLRPLALERLAAALVRHQSAVATIGARVCFDERGHRRRVPHPRLQRVRHVWADVVAGWCGGQGQCLIRRHFLLAAGSWSENLFVAEDHELWLRLARLGPAILVPWDVLECRVHRGQHRPANTTTIEETFRRGHIQALPERERQRGERLFRAWKALSEATRAWDRGDPWHAFRSALVAVGAAPELSFSPVMPIATLLARCFIGVLIGRRAIFAVRRMKIRCREVARSNPGRDRPVMRIANYRLPAK